MIKIPTKENSFWDLINSYYKFYKLDLSHFDLIISTKYPAWMVKHKNHICYMQHCLRGLYDTYIDTGLPLEVEINHKKIGKLIDLIDNQETTLDNLFTFLKEIKNDNSIPKEHYTFPGPLIRKIIHFLDNKSKKEIKSFFAISETVSKRDEYFPKNTKVTIIHHPSNLEVFEEFISGKSESKRDEVNYDNYKYFLTVSRSDGPKRLEMIVKAYLISKTKIPLKIVGAKNNELEKSCANDKRINWLGFVSDRELINLYKKSYAVIYCPDREDYGLVTIEAMGFGKAVITCHDSGGVLEFVKNSETGYICEPKIESLKKIIEKCSYEKNKNLNNSKLEGIFNVCSESKVTTGSAILDQSQTNKIIKMGNNGFNKINNINWENTFNALIGEKFNGNVDEKDLKDITNNDDKVVVNEVNEIKKITVVSIHNTYPPIWGGQRRIFNISKQLSEEFSVEIVSLSDENRFNQINENLIEISIAKSNKHLEKEKYLEKELGDSTKDLAILHWPDSTINFIKEVKRSAKNASFVICAYPFFYPHLSRIINNKIIHDSQNVEYVLKEKILKKIKKNKKANQFLSELFTAEKKSCNEAFFTSTCSELDAEKMKELYDLKENKTLIIPNGVDTNLVEFVSIKKRKRNKKENDLTSEKLVLFLGSWHIPNIEAVKNIFIIAKKLQEVKFLIMGTVCEYFKNENIPNNVGLLGIISDQEINKIFSLVDIAINPMTFGSGTNIKMLNYLAAGIPVISTKKGARGLGIPSGLIEICEVKFFADTIKKMLENNNDLNDKVEKARIFIEDNFSWDVIGNKFRRHIIDKLL